MMTPQQHALLRDRFRKVFESRWDPSELENFDELRELFALHMTEVATNFSSLADFYRSPDTCDTNCLTDKVEMFFVDCVPHLMAAAQIYDEIPQLFEEQNGVHDWDSFRDSEVTP